MPLGGFGRRFADCGYTRPKPLVRVMGKEIIFWVLDSLMLQPEDQIYIPYNESLEHHTFPQTISLRYPGVRTLAIPDTRGASETVKLCVDHFALEGRVVVLDGDTWYEEDILGRIRACPGSVVAYFESTTPEPIYSYIVTNGDRVAEIREKQKISDMANSGCYVFSDAKRFSQAVSRMDLNRSGETYISQVIARMIEEGEDFLAIPVDKFHVLGTPEQIIGFSKSYQHAPKRFCFDLDNTLVSAPRTKGDYSSVDPIHETINYLRKLKSKGHTIIIYTARRMRTHGGNVGAVVADIASVTTETLRKFGIPYDELHFGKPYAHFYIDDLMVDPQSDMNKALGFYMEDVMPRHFNSVEKGETFRKSSTNKTKLEGEAFYYRWVQQSCQPAIQEMFPRLISCGEGFLETEMIRGLNFSTLYLNQILREETLANLMTCLRQLHAVKQDDTVHYSYANLEAKFVSRMEMYDYSRYGITTDLVEDLKKRLGGILAEGFGRVMVHGDPVFSNVLLDAQGRIRLVDVRGADDRELTVFGHELYDFAKVYQSLSGYDEVLLDKRVTFSYRRSLVEFFERQFDLSTMEKIRTITASLLLSLVPLHDDESKHGRYVELALRLL